MIDKTAIIDSTAIIDDSAIIGPNVVIGKNVKIGARTRVIANAYIECSEIGEDCVISPFSTIGTEPQDLGYKGEDTKVIIGNGNIIKENVTIHRASACGKFATIIGNKCLIMAGVHVAHNCILEDEVILANLVTLGGHITVGFGAFVGGMSVFHQNIRIGKLSIVSGFSAARRDILPYSKGEGRPPIARGLNIIALRRRGYSREDINIASRALKILVSGAYNTTQAIEKIEAELEINQIVREMIDFIRSSKRGVTLLSAKTGASALE